MPWQRAAGRALNRCGPETQAAAERRGFEGGGWFRYRTAAAEPGRRGQEKPHGAGRRSGREGSGRREGVRRLRPRRVRGGRRRGDGLGRCRETEKREETAGRASRGRQVSWSHITEQTVGDPISRRHHAPARHAPSPSKPWQTRTQCWKENIFTHTTEEGQNGQGKGSEQVGHLSLEPRCRAGRVLMDCLHV